MLTLMELERDLPVRPETDYPFPISSHQMRMTMT